MDITLFKKIIDFKDSVIPVINSGNLQFSVKSARSTFGISDYQNSKIYKSKKEITFLVQNREEYTPEKNSCVLEFIPDVCVKGILLTRRFPLNEFVTK